MERIASAAIRYGGKIYTGRAHYDIRETIRLDKGTYPKVPEQDEGFITDTGRFVSRQEAGEIAFKAGQTHEKQNCLKSYHLIH